MFNQEPERGVGSRRREGGARGDQSRQTSEAGTAGSGPRHSDVLEQTRMRALQHAAASQHLSAPSSKTARRESRSMESSSAAQRPVNLDPPGPSMEAELSEPVIPSVDVDSPKSAESEVISSPHTQAIDLEEEEEDEAVPQSWEQREQAPMDMEALIKLEQEGIAENDFDKSWARMEDINDVELERRNPPIDRSRVKTYHLDPGLLLEAPQEPSFKKPNGDIPAWKIREQFIEKLSACNAKRKGLVYPGQEKYNRGCFLIHTENVEAHARRPCGRI